MGLKELNKMTTQELLQLKNKVEFLLKRRNKRVNRQFVYCSIIKKKKKIKRYEKSGKS